MIIGGSKTRVIANIKQAVSEQDYNRKVEEGDAELGIEDELLAVQNFYALRDKPGFRLKHAAMQKMNEAQAKAYDKLIKIEGAKKLQPIEKVVKDGKGIIVTSNHFNPLDNLCIKKMLKQSLNLEPYIVVQAGNLAATGVIGELFNYLDHIPVAKSTNYIRGEFLSRLKDAVVKEGRPVLIYSEEEMWFNYRKPRPNKRGAFYFAAELGVPVVPCFVEILDTTRPDNDEFFESEYIVHVLEPIFPDETKSSRQNSIMMAEKDYELKKAAYERAYGKKLDYRFEKSDIANLKNADAI